MRMPGALLRAGLSALLVASLASSAWAGGYTFTNFDGPPDFTQGTTVNAINNLGQAVGFNTAANASFNNFIRNVPGRPRRRDERVVDHADHGDQQLRRDRRLLR